MDTTAGLERRIRSGLVWSALSNVGLRFGNVLVSVIVARILAPHEFGLFMVGLAVVMILNSFADLGMNPYLVRSDDVEGQAPTIMTLGVALSCALGLAMLLLAHPIAELYGTPDAAPIIAALSISMAINGLHIVPGSIMERAYMQDKQFLANALGMVVSTAVTVVLVRAGMGAMSLAWGRIAGQVGTLALMYWFVRRWPAFTARPQRVREVAAFGIPLSGANLLSLLLVNIGSVAVARGLGEAALGLYMLALNLSSWPLNIVGQSVRAVALPAFAQQGRMAAARLFGPAAAITWAAALPLSVLLAIFGHPLVEVMYGSVWAPAAAVLDGLAVYGAFRVLFDVAVTYATAHGATRSVLLAQVWWNLALIPCIAVGVSRFGLAGAGWSQVLTAAALVLPAYLWIIHRAGASVVDLARRCLPPTVVVVVAAVVARVVTDAVAGPPLARVLVGGALFTLLYVAPLYRWGIRQLATLRSGRDARGGDPADTGRVADPGVPEPRLVEADLSAAWEGGPPAAPPRPRPDDLHRARGRGAPRSESPS